ncbi:transposase family protein, partial [Microcoleus sp. N3A4]
MSLILEYLEKHPKEAKRLIGITAVQFQDLCSHAEILSQQKSEQVEINKIRINRKGAGCKPKLSIKEQVLLTLVYLSQLHTFQYLGIQFEVSESTAHNIFHKWV